MHFLRFPFLFPSFGFFICRLVFSPRYNLVFPKWVLQGVEDIFVAVTASHLAIFIFVEMEGSQRLSPWKEHYENWDWCPLLLSNWGPPLYNNHVLACQVILCHELETEVFVFKISGTVLFCGKGAKKLLGGKVGGKTDRTLLAAPYILPVQKDQ